MLSWFVGMDAAEAAMKGKVITEDVAETIPENVKNACIDECVRMYVECKVVFLKLAPVLKLY